MIRKKTWYSLLAAIVVLACIQIVMINRESSANNDLKNAYKMLREQQIKLSNNQKKVQSTVKKQKNDDVDSRNTEGINVKKQGKQILKTLADYKSGTGYRKNQQKLTQLINADVSAKILPVDDDGTGHSYIDAIRQTSYISDMQVWYTDLQTVDTSNGTTDIYLTGMIHGGHRDDAKRFNSVGVPVTYVGMYDWKQHKFIDLMRVGRFQQQVRNDRGF